ncbi:MAG TPA: carboxypeptidase regulatory-like domain-containing protein [Candidatus Thermoplasmatota archaeon]|nr:carboxypeptidase regulatory-like domain-containing protein [Candidatus Thermoplasmatota archaeon]
MDRKPSALVLTAVFLLGAIALVPHPIDAQVSNSLDVDVCSRDRNVNYVQAPEPGDAAGCGPALGNVQLHLTKAGVGGTGALAVDKSGTTNQNGTYTFSGSDLTAGTYTLELKRVGYETMEFQLNIQGATERRVGLVPRSIDVKGTVTDQDGKGLPKAHVTVCCANDFGMTDTYTDADGAFTVTTQSGERTFSVDSDGMQLASVSQFVDGTQGVALRVPEAPRQDATLHGVVRDQDGTPLPGFTINVYSYGGYGGCCHAYDTSTSSGTASPASASSPSSGMAVARPYYGNGYNSTVTDREGRYSIHVASGVSVSMNVYHEGYANHYANVEVTGASVAHDIEMQKFPPKTAHIEGRVVDASTGKGLSALYIGVQSPRYGLYECSQDASQADDSPPKPAQETPPSDPESPTSSDVSYPYPGGYSNGCAIRVNSDGTFSGDVTPGYTVLSVGHDAYRDCPQTDGNYRPCRPEHYAWNQVLDLPADATTKVTVRLEQRPAPDAVVSGYVVDASTGKAIPNAQVSFSSQDGYGYGSATTDKDGSYSIKVRSGHMDVYAYAEGHLHWVGMLTLKSGETPFDIQLTPGQESNGGCCMYASAGAKEAPMAASADGSAAYGTASATRSAGGAGGSGSGAAFEDLHGGLGPYDAAARAKAVEGASRSSPGAGLLALVSLLGCAALLQRRRQD